MSTRNNCPIIWFDNQEDFNKIADEIEADLDDVMVQENISKAAKLHRKLRVLSADDLLRPFMTH